MSDPMDSLQFDGLHDWFQKGILVHRLRGSDGKKRNSWKGALQSLSVGFTIAALIEFLVLLMFQKDLKFETYSKLPIFAIPPLVGLLCFLASLLVWLRVMRVKLSAGVTFSLTCYVFSGALPLLMFWSFEPLSDAIRLFRTRGDPSLPYVASATLNLLFSQEASTFAVIRAWAFFVLELATFAWYIIWHLRRVLVEASSGTRRNFRVTIALIFAIALNALIFRFYVGRLYWGIIGRLLL